MLDARAAAAHEPRLGGVGPAPRRAPRARGRGRGHARRPALAPPGDLRWLTGRPPRTASRSRSAGRSATTVRPTGRARRRSPALPEAGIAVPTPRRNARRSGRGAKPARGGSGSRPPSSGGPPEPSARRRPTRVGVPGGARCGPARPRSGPPRPRRSAAAGGSSGLPRTRPTGGRPGPRAPRPWDDDRRPRDDDRRGPDDDRPRRDATGGGRPPFRGTPSGYPRDRERPRAGGFRPGPPGDRPGPRGDRRGPPGFRPGPADDRRGAPADRQGRPGAHRPGPPGDRPGPPGDRHGPPGFRPRPPGAFRAGAPGAFRAGPPAYRPGPPARPSGPGPVPPRPGPRSTRASARPPGRPCVSGAGPALPGARPPPGSAVVGPRAARACADAGRGRGDRRRPPARRGGVRGPPRGAPPARRPAAPPCAREARAARDEPADPRGRGRGRHADVGRRVRRPPGHRAGRGTARVGRRPTTSSRSRASASQPPLVLVLDSLEDPQNVGTLLRTAEASGVHGAIFPTHHQAPLTPAAIKASAGAVEHLRLAPVDDLPGALADLHARGLRIVGADGDAPLTAREADFRGPVAIVVGSEGKGLGAAVRRRCDLLVRIPMHGRIDSLNAAVAGSILLYEAAAQRGTGRQPDDDASAAPVPEPTAETADPSAPPSRPPSHRPPSPPRPSRPTRPRANPARLRATPTSRHPPPTRRHPSPTTSCPASSRTWPPNPPRPRRTTPRRPPTTPRPTLPGSLRRFDAPGHGPYHSPARGVLLLFDAARVPT